MVRSAEAGARDFIAMVLAGIDSETDIGVVETLHADVVTALTSYVDPARPRRDDGPGGALGPRTHDVGRGPAATVNSRGRASSSGSRRATTTWT